MGLDLKAGEKQLPQNTQLEISLIGTGGGYGESVVIHLGYNNWIVVDSCVDPFTKRSIPLDYLLSRGVDIANDVKMIICTHWHDDHIKGISQLLEKSQNAMMSMSACTGQSQFCQFVELDYLKVENNPSNSTTEEIEACLNLLKKRKSPIKKASQDKLLYSLKNSININVFSLSPSDYVIQQFDYEISELFEMCNPDVRIPPETQNDKSVALLIEANGNCVLLGADLEVSTNREKGWMCILDKCQCLSKQSSLFKIPHHGSITGYHQQIWNDLLTSNVTGILTPYNRGKNILPDYDMINKFLNHTEYLYITSDIGISRSAKKRNNDIKKMAEQFNNTVQEVKFNSGIIKCTLDIGIDNPQWNIDLIGTAKQLAIKNCI